MLVKKNLFGLMMIQLLFLGFFLIETTKLLQPVFFINALALFIVVLTLQQFPRDRKLNRLLVGLFILAIVSLGLLFIATLIQMITYSMP